MLTHIASLGVKELRSLWADKVLLVLIVWAFTGAIYAASTGVSQELRHAPVAVADEDRSPLSQRLTDTLTPPYFTPPRQITLAEADRELDHGRVSFVILIPPNFQKDLTAGRHPELSILIDATNMSQSFIGSGYIQRFFSDEILRFLGPDASPKPPEIRLVTRVRFNPNLTGFWFGGIMELINMVTMLTVILVGAAVIREREHGTLEHLLAMPVTPFEIMLAKIWANGLVVLAGTTLALKGVIQGVLSVPVPGSIPLFLCGVALYLFSAASMGIFLATVARSMPQFGLLFILIITPLQMLSGGVTPRESMPALMQDLMLAAPTTHFVRLAQGLLYRGAGLELVWREFVAILTIGAVFFGLALVRFRHSVSATQG